MNKKAVLALVFLASFLVLPLALADSSNATTDFTSYGDQLSADEIIVYDACVDPFEDGSDPLEKNWNDSNPTPTVGVIDQSIIDIAVKAASLDHPGYFWLLKEITYNGSTLSFDISDLDLDANNKMKSFASSIEGDTISEKIAAINSKLRSEVEYVEYLPEDDDYNVLDGTAYGAIINKKANAYGFAAAFTFCAEELYIKAVTLCGELNDPDSSKPHAWNVVQDEGWYGVDVALNKQKETNTYLMMAAYDHGYQTDYTFKVSHSANMSSYLGTDVVINTPVLKVREIEPPIEPTLLEKYGQHILVITIITILCVVMFTYAKRG